MGCASSAPFMDGGPVAEIKGAANEMIESGEHAFHDMTDMASKTAHNAMDQVKGAVNHATHNVQEAASHVGNAAGEAVHSIVGGKPPEKLTREKSMPEAIQDLTNNPQRSPSPEMAQPPKEMFRPTPAPSFDKPPTPMASISDIIEAPMEKIEEATSSFTLDELTDDLMKETAAVMSEAGIKEDGDEAKLEAAEMMESPAELELHRPTKWEALADAIVELPPRMSIDLETGQLYAVVDDNPPPPPSKKHHYSKPAVVKDVVEHAS